jgi:hypothetical protein
MWRSLKGSNALMFPVKIFYASLFLPCVLHTATTSLFFDFFSFKGFYFIYLHHICSWNQFSKYVPVFSSLQSPNGRKGLTQIIRKAWSGIRRGPKLIKALVLAVYKLSSKKRPNFSLGTHTTVFQAKIYAFIKACIMEDT